MTALNGHSLWILSTLLFLVFFVPIFHAESELGANRDERLLSLFQIVRFPNAPCVGNSGKNGTCYTSAECSTRGGVSSGNCAQGYGVCCTFTVSCGRTSSENCTYFESTGSGSGSCAVQICKCNSRVCQLRLDFNQFVISGPSTASDSVGLSTFGNPTAAGASITQQSQCLTDTFAVTNQGGRAPPTICGTNTGEHMYVDSADGCNDLVFQLGNAGVGTAIANRQWSIKITQYDCNHPNLAPDGCTQYFYGSNIGTVQSFNYAEGQHLANQDQNICVRRERGNCRICWTTEQDTDFEVSGMTASVMGFAKSCCGYGMTGASTKLADCVTIPGALNPMSSSLRATERYCGRLGLVSATGSTTATICSNRSPFNLRFLTDGSEFAGESLAADKGFRLTYIQSSQNC